MLKNRLTEILTKIPRCKIMVIGDYFLDDYLTLDRSLSEPSLETGLDAYQVIETRKYPGVSGVVAANLRGLGAQVLALGLAGNDGNGYELRKKLVENGVDVQGLIEIPGYATPTYHKPMMREPDGCEHELNRMDVKPRVALASHLEDQIILMLKRLIHEVDGVLVVDQAQGKNFGVITDRVREAIQNLAATEPGKMVAVDSRHYLGLFKHMILKANLSEAIRALDTEQLQGENAIACAKRCAQELISRTNHPVIITLGNEGIYLQAKINEPGTIIQAIPVTGEVDIVGAGDSVCASVGAALCTGATLDEACFIGNIVASIVIKQIGVTGTASSKLIIEQYEKYFDNKKN